MAWALIRVYNGILVVVKGNTGTRPVNYNMHYSLQAESLFFLAPLRVCDYIHVSGPIPFSIYRMYHLVSLPEAKELLRTDIMISRHGL